MNLLKYFVVLGEKDPDILNLQNHCLMKMCGQKNNTFFAEHFGQLQNVDMNNYRYVQVHKDI